MGAVAIAFVSIGCGARSELSLPHASADASVGIAEVADTTDTRIASAEDITPIDAWEPDPRCPQIGSGPPPGAKCADEGLVCRYVDDCDLELVATCVEGAWKLDRRPCG